MDDIEIIQQADGLILTEEQGPPGARGNSILSQPGGGPPAGNFGIVNDFYWDYIGKLMYGPKVNPLFWPAGVLIGGEGPEGPQGSIGPAGPTGPVPWQPIVLWQTGVNYTATAPASTVSHDPDGSFVCAESHTSGTFATDLAAGKWIAVVPNPTSLAVAKAGDRMTGTLRVGAVLATAANAGSVVAVNLATDTDFSFNATLDAAGTGYRVINNGFSGGLTYDAPTGFWNFWSTFITGTAGGTLTKNLVGTMSPLGVWHPTGIELSRDDINCVNISRAASPTHTMDIGPAVIGEMVIHAQNENFSIYKDSVQRIRVTTASVQIGAGTVNGTSLDVQGPGGFANYAIKGTANHADAGGVIGYATNAITFGICGHNISGVDYSFYGNAGAFIASGSWATSDGRLKDVNGEVDTAEALGVVNEIAVKRYTAARGATLHPDPDEELVGWIAQDVERWLPMAVQEVPIHPEDLATRAAMKGLQRPEKTSVEAGWLSEQDMKLKAVNDRYLLATLWAAVQELSRRLDKQGG